MIKINGKKIKAMTTKTLQIEGMHCQGCEAIIEKTVGLLPGVVEGKADYSTETLRVVFDHSRIDFPAIVNAVNNAGYVCSLKPRVRSFPKTLSRLLIVILMLVGIGLLMVVGDSISGRLGIPELEADMSYGLLFLVGLLTGFHCVGMCGGFVLGYTAKAASSKNHKHWFSHLMYGGGKTLSYTLIGGLFGLLGSFIAFTPAIRGYAAVGSGLFLVVFGINMLDWFPVLHRINFRMPRFLNRFLGKERRKHQGPFVIGLLNGLMIACGPLQAMYVMAAGTGDWLEGSKMMLVFGLGTLPIMLGFGFLAGTVSGKFTHNLLSFSALLVIMLGFIMTNRGLILTGNGYDIKNVSSRIAQSLEETIHNLPSLELPPEFFLKRWQNPSVLSRSVEGTGQFSDVRVETRLIIRMTVTGKGYQPNQFILKQGVPVRLVIQGSEITQCNKHLLIPSLGLDIELHEGENIVEFTPEQSGVIPFSCWMGMLQGSFVVQPATVSEDSD